MLSRKKNGSCHGSLETRIGEFATYIKKLKQQKTEYSELPPFKGSMQMRSYKVSSKLPESQRQLCCRIDRMISVYKMNMLESKISLKVNILNNKIRNKISKSQHSLISSKIFNKNKERIIGKLMIKKSRSSVRERTRYKKDELSYKRYYSKHNTPKNDENQVKPWKINSSDRDSPKNVNEYY